MGGDAERERDYSCKPRKHLVLESGSLPSHYIRYIRYVPELSCIEGRATGPTSFLNRPAFVCAICSPYTVTPNPGSSRWYVPAAIR